jgi:hypothetical protein
VSPKSELEFLCAFDSAVCQELWISSFPQGVSPDAEGCCVIVFRPSNWADAVDEVVHSVECQIGSGEQRQVLEDKQWKKALEEKMDNVIWKLNLIIVAVVCVVFGCLLGMYAEEVILMLKVVLLLHLCR